VRPVIVEGPVLEDCVGVLVDAFAREPAVLRVCGHDPVRRTAWFDALLRTHATVPGLRLMATAHGRAVGVAVATAPGARPTAMAQAAWTARTWKGCGPRALVRTLEYLRRTEPWKPAGAWTLEFVGVQPEERGQGLARALFDQAKDAYPGAPAFLTTADPDNVALYRRWGFSPLVRVALGKTTVVAMVLPPPPEASTNQ
jgi:GNAT superfamily N-acetyltransferase